MSGIIGLSNKEITALAEALRVLDDVARITRVESYTETAQTIGEILKRVSPRYGGREETSSSQLLLQLLHEMLPPEDDAA